MAIGQGYAYVPGHGWVKVADARMWAFHGSSGWRPVKAAWAFHGSSGWGQWYPHGGGTVPPHPGGGTTHTATAAATVTSTRVSWHIPSSRHVKTQRLTITNTHGVHAAGRLNGHAYSLNQGESFSITVTAGTRSVSISMTGSKITRASVRYTYTT